MNKNRIFALLLAAVMGLSLTACGKTEEKEKTETSSKAVESASESSAENTADVSATHQNDPLLGKSASDICKEIKLGWNLGNTFDATGNSTLAAETAWLPSGHKTDELMFTVIKDAGFSAVRIPVSWGEHMADDYTVDPDWMNRVQEVVNYGIDNGLYVILNTHHEEWYMPTADNVDQDLEQLEALWKQIAERFKGYDEHLIFEGVNEPRLRGQGAEWTGTADSREIVNRYADTFVKTVRATGGNNAERSLMVTGYAASSSATNLQAIEIPENAGNVIVSVHAYLPYSFALDTKGTDKYDPNDNSIKNLFSDIQTYFLDNGIPVIVGEFGSVNKYNTEDRVACLNDYLTEAQNHGVPVFWWDNEARIGEGENFGLLNRADHDWYFPELMDVFKKFAG